MRRAWVGVLGLAILLGVAVPASTQSFAPQPPPVPPKGDAAPPTICSTDYGWCPIQYAATAAGGYCACFYPPNNTWITGRARYWAFDPATASPYLNPHTGPPTTIR